MEVCRWGSAHASIDITGEKGALATCNGTSGWVPAAGGEVLQADGEAYAELTWVGGSGCMVGVARAGVDPRQPMGSDWLGNTGWYGTPNGWMYACANGNYLHNFTATNAETPWASGTKQAIATGETVGLLLQRGSLHVYLKGRRAGTLVSGLSGQLVWATDLYQQGSSVRIARKPAPK
jgi:hypothetical protein